MSHAHEFEYSHPRITILVTLMLLSPHHLVRPKPWFMNFQLFIKYIQDIAILSITQWALRPSLMVMSATFVTPFEPQRELTEVFGVIRVKWV